MHDFILNIDNKEVLIEILHHAIDCLIESPPNQHSSPTPPSHFAKRPSSGGALGSNNPSAPGHAPLATSSAASSTDNSNASAHHKFGFAHADEFDSAIRFIGVLCRRHAQRELDDAALLRLHFAHLPADLQQSVLDVLSTRRPDVLAHLLSEFNSRERPLLQSIDWDVRWVMGSSQLAVLRRQLATMVWQCRQPPNASAASRVSGAENGAAAVADGSGTISFEMNREQVRDMIGQLEECAKQMDLRTGEEEQAGVKV